MFVLLCKSRCAVDFDLSARLRYSVVIKLTRKLTVCVFYKAVCGVGDTRSSFPFISLGVASKPSAECDAFNKTTCCFMCFKFRTSSLLYFTHLKVNKNNKLVFFLWCVRKVAKIDR